MAPSRQASAHVRGPSWLSGSPPSGLRRRLTLGLLRARPFNPPALIENLKILSLGRNNIKNLAGLEQVADNLEQLWVSYCLIEKLKGVAVLKKVKTLYMSNNKVKDWKEFDQLKDMTSLEELLMVGNPLEEKHSAEGDWVEQVSARLPNLKKLDGIPIVR